MQLGNGDKVIVKGGTTNYVQVFVTPTYYNGNAAFDSIIIRSGHLHSPQWGTTQAVFDEQATRVYGFWLAGAAEETPLNGVTIEGFEIKNVAPGGIGPEYDPNNGSSGVVQGGNHPVRYSTVRQCIIHDCVRGNGGAPDPYDKGHGMQISYVTNLIVSQCIIGPNVGTKGIETVDCWYGAISNNMFWGCGDHQIALTRSHRLDVCNNIIDRTPPQITEPDFGIAVPNCVQCDIWNNLIFRSVVPNTGTTTAWAGAPGITAYSNTACGIGVYNTGEIASGNGYSNRIVFNTVCFFYDANNGQVSTAVAIGDYQTTNPAGYTNYNTLFANNLCFSNQNNKGNIQYFIDKPSTWNDEVRYNDFFHSTGSEDVLESCNAPTHNWPADFTLDQVADWTPGTGHTFANNQQVNPAIKGGSLPTGWNSDFTAPNNDYFALTASSPAAVTNTANQIVGSSYYGWRSDSGKFERDIAGNLRTTYWPMGAYGLGGGSSPAPTKALTADRLTVETIRWR